MATAQQRKFKAANKKCHASTNSPSAFGRCMSSALKSAGGSKKRKAKKKVTCAGLRKSGKNKGKLKPGYTWKGARGSCPRKAR